MGTRWRQAKSKLIESLRDASKMRDKESIFASLKPDNLSLQEWNTFIAEKLSNEFEVNSVLYKYSVLYTFFSNIKIHPFESVYQLCCILFFSNIKNGVEEEQNVQGD